MNSNKNKFFCLPAQVAIARADKLDLGCSAYQCGQRQYSRFLGMLKNVFGGKKNLQHFLEKEQFVHRMLPPLQEWAGMKPLEKRYANKRSKDAKARSKRMYYERLAKDLMDPAKAKKREMRRFDAILKAMDRAKRGEEYFYPYPARTTEASTHGGPEGQRQDKGTGKAKEGTGKAEGKGKRKSTWMYIHHNLLEAGLEVPNARPPPAAPWQWGRGGGGGSGSWWSRGGGGSYGSYGGGSRGKGGSRGWEEGPYGQRDRGWHPSGGRWQA
jgi:hypothetical protein